MERKNVKKFFAGIMSSVMLCSAAPAAYAEALPASLTASSKSAAEASNAIFSTGFENGEGIDQFTGRKGVEVIEATTEDAYSGEYSMKVSGRENGWNGPQFLIGDDYKPNTEYTINVAAKAEWYNNVMLSWEYTDTSGERHYNNLKSATSNGNWVTFENIKFSFTEDMTNVYVYIECGDTANLYIDDFSIAESAYIPIEEDIPSLSEVYSDYFRIGTALTPSALSSKSLMALVEKHFSGSITLGNEMKPDSVLNQSKCIAAYEETGDDTNPPVSFELLHRKQYSCKSPYACLAQPDSGLVL